MPLSKEELDEFTESFLEEDDNENVIEDQQKEDDDVKNDDVGSPNKEEAPEQNLSDGSSLWDGASEEQRSEASRLQSQLATTQNERDTFQHAADSDRGRHKALHAKAEEQRERADSLEKELNTLKAKGIDFEVDDGEYTPDELKDIRSDLPEVSALINQETKSLKKEVAELRESQQPVAEKPPADDFFQEQSRQQQDTQRIARSQEMGKVLKVHEDFDDIIRDPSYATWLGRAAPGVRNMASSSLAADAIQLITMFKDSRTPEDHSDDLNAMQDIPRKGVPTSSLESEEDDFDAAFEHFGEQIREGRSSH